MHLDPISLKRFVSIADAAKLGHIAPAARW